MPQESTKIFGHRRGLGVATRSPRYESQKPRGHDRPAPRRGSPRKSRWEERLVTIRESSRSRSSPLFLLPSRRSHDGRRTRLGLQTPGKKNLYRRRKASMARSQIPVGESTGFPFCKITAQPRTSETEVAVPASRGSAFYPPLPSRDN